MRAALIRELGGRPELAIVDNASDTDGLEIEMLAAPLNPLDLSVASGHFGGGHPPLPYIPGVEGVGRRTDSGALVYCMGGGLGIGRNGCVAERFITSEASVFPVSEDIGPELAAALGTPGLAAWLALEWKGALSEGETVVVLGATGAGGRLALQAARILGAGRIIGVGRRGPRLDAVARFADATVDSESGDYTGCLAAACPGGAQLVLDFVWGRSLEGALPALSIGGRVVQIGAASSATGTLPSALMRARRMTIFGFTNFAAPLEVVAATYRRLLKEAVAGHLVLDTIETLPLGRVSDAWKLLLKGGRKVVLRY